MRDLLADRFVAFERTWIDLSSGARVRLRFAPSAQVSEAIIWSDLCAERARLRHPLMNVLLDYGVADVGRTFEAYSVGEPIRATGRAASQLLQHAARFMESRGLPLSAHVAPVALREVVPGQVLYGSSRRPRRDRVEHRAAGVRLSSGRTLGLILQPRAILESLCEALEVAAPGGTTSFEIAGGRGSGIRTTRLLAARTARLAGFVPVASSVLIRLPWLRECLAGRHLCVFLDDHPPGERATLAIFLAQLGVSSTRRHVLLRFTSTEAPRSGARWIDTMGIAAMTSMVFVDGDHGPSHEELFDAARGASGRPGLLLERLRATYVNEPTPRIALVHESSPAYVFRRPAPRPRSRGVGRVLRDAPYRGARLAARGRHASAIRLLARASRVLEARGETALAAACAEQLAWIERGRGQSSRALEQFERARALAGRNPPPPGDGHPPSGPARPLSNAAPHCSPALSECGNDANGIGGVIGMGVVWTDERRLIEAEASLRGACAAADLMGDLCLGNRARRALARCLHWQSRHDEAAMVLEALVRPSSGDGHTDTGRIEAWALLARTRAALGSVRGALAAAGEAVNRAAEIEVPRVKAAAFRSMAIVQRLVGDDEQVRVWSERALRIAAAGHLPLAGLRARCLLATSRGSAPDSARATRWLVRLRAAVGRRRMPALLCLEVEDACARVGGDSHRRGQTSASERAMLDLEALLEMAHAASDETAALDAVCQFVGERLRAATVQIVTGPPEPRTLARAGRPWQGDAALVTRVLACGASGTVVPIAESGEPRQAAEPIRFGREAIAVLCARWTLGTLIDADRASALLRAAALASSSSVRSLLERPAPLVADHGFSELLGSSEAASNLRASILRAARAPFPVLVEGESGSGKELVARGVHRLGPRRDRRLCTINCAALSDDLLEAELFGHARGAFTGAVGERAGLFEEADGGTIFLDEVGELSPRAQAKLLRVLQDGEVRRVGENMPRRVDARIVAATNRRLEEEVAANRFRADLRFRLDVVRIVVPPLRDRASDIPALASHFWTEAAARLGTSATLTAETLSTLARYDWPGNVRELQNVLASLAVHAPRRGRIAPAVLPIHIARSAAAGASTFEAARREFERRFVRAALAHAGGQRARAARTLGLSRQGLAKMLRRLRIDEKAG